MAYKDPDNPYPAASAQPKTPKPAAAPSFDYESAQGRQDFMKWYNQQQGGNRPEDLDRFWHTPKGVESGETFKRWDPYLQREGQYAGKYKSSRGAEGYFDKPTECPPGMMPSGPRETDPCVPNASAVGGGGAGGGGGRGGRGGRGGGGGSQFDNPVYQYLKGKALGPDWLNTWMGQGGMSGFQSQMDQARAQAQQIQDPTMRAAALARIPQMQASLGTQARQGAEQARLGLLSGQLMPQEYQYAGLGENARQANMQNALGWGNLGVTKELGLGNLALGGRAEDRLGAAQAWQQNTYFPWEQSEAQANRDLSKWSLQQQLQASKPSFWDRLGGVVTGGIGALTGLKQAGGLGGLFKGIF